MSKLEGILEKMNHDAEQACLSSRPLSYRLFDFEISSLLGQKLVFVFEGKIFCIHCGRAIKKAFGEGACYPCFQKKAACDLCIVKPELCHFAQGTCREPEWGKTNCLIPHVVYLSNTTGLKVGITRHFKKFERWGDQGSFATLEFAKVPERLVAGQLEVALSAHLDDKSDWRALITGKSFEVDLLAARERASAFLNEDHSSYLLKDEAKIFEFQYPVMTYPAKAVSHNLEKEPTLSGELQGIRGQYVFIGGRAINIRKHSGYQVRIEY